MPYIKRDRRIPADKRGYEAKTAGELNYAITRLCDLFLNDHGPSYENINTIVGALECAKHEFYRRIAVPYEDRAIRVNGDVYASLHLVE